MAESGKEMYKAKKKIEIKTAYIHTFHTQNSIAKKKWKEKK